MGKILGWARMVGASPSLPDEANPDTEYSVDAAHDRMQLEIYLRAKDYYERCKREFFDYARRGPKPRGGRRPTRGFRKNLGRARGYTEYAATLQLLGAEEGTEADLENARREVENACYKLWDNYRDNPDNKETLFELIEDGLVNAQLYGIDDSPIVRKIEHEIGRLISSGKLK